MMLPSFITNALPDWVDALCALWMVGLTFVAAVAAFTGEI